jgi:hypothetical protein
MERAAFIVPSAHGDQPRMRSCLETIGVNPRVLTLVSSALCQNIVDLRDMSHGHNSLVGDLLGHWLQSGWAIVLSKFILF